MSHYLTDRTGEDDERLLTAAAVDSALFYGGPAMGRNPLEALLAAEAEGAGEGAEEARARVMGDLLKRVLMFAVEGIEERVPQWRAVERCVSVREGEVIRGREEKGCPMRGWGTVERVVEGTGEVLERWEPARVLKQKGARNGRRPYVRMWLLMEVGRPGALPMQVGKRVLALAHLSAIPGVAHLSGSALARLCDETRQAVSLRERGLDEAMRVATGGKRGARGLRHTVDPRKGVKKEG
jgi:hypothetical protein